MTRVIWVILVVLVIFFSGMAMSTKAAAQPVERRSVLAVLDEAFTHPVCLAPVLAGVFLSIVCGGTRFIVWLKHTQLDLSTRAVEIERQRVQVEQVRQSVSQTRVLLDAAGRQVLVSPTLATRPVTRLDTDDAPDSEQLRAAAMLTHALARAGFSSGPNGGGGRLSPDLAALLLYGNRPAVEDELPPHVRVLTAEETAQLPPVEGA